MLLVPPRLRRAALAALAVALLLAPAGLVLAGEAPASAPAAADPAEEAYQDALERCEGIEDTLVRTVEKVRPNTVAVQNLRRVKLRGMKEPRLMRVSGGSGVIITRAGKLWILTNVHVVHGSEALKVVTCDGVVRDVKLHDSIPEYDIALLEFAERPHHVKFHGVSVRKNNSLRGITEGTWVIATGNPFFLGEDGRCVCTLGVISGLDRYLGGQYQYVGAIQHDAEVNPGNSGGPLWDLKGDFVGINGKIATGQRLQGVGPSNTGAAFSLPVHQIDAYLRQLIGDEDAQAGFLGVSAETKVDDKGKAVGARITKIDRKSPMLGKRDAPQVGDVITSVTAHGRRKTVYTASDLREVLSVLEAGTSVHIRYKRGRRYHSWKGDLAERKR